MKQGWNQRRKRGLLVVILLIALGGLGWGIWKWVYIPRKGAEQLALAQSLLTAQKPSEALAPAAYASEVLPKNAAAKFTYAQAITLSGGDSAQAYTLYAQAYTLDSTNYYHALRLAHFDRLLGNTPRATHLLDRLVGSFSDSSAVFYERGLLYAQTGDLERAYEFYTKSIELDGQNLEALRARGAQAAHIADFKGAIADWDKIIASGDDDGTLLAKRGEFKLKIMDFQGALSDLRKAQALGIGSVQLRIALGQAYLNTDKPDSARLTVEKGMALYPHSDSLLRLRALTYLRCNEPKKAITDLDAIIEKKGEDIPRMLYFRGVAKMQAGNYQGAIGDYSSAIKQSHELTDAYFNRGVAYAYSGDFDRAIQDYSEVIRRTPKYAMARYVRGVAYISLDRFKEGCKDLRDAAEMGSKKAKQLIPTYCD